jgi:hypothetical protein
LDNIELKEPSNDLMISLQSELDVLQKQVDDMESKMSGFELSAEDKSERQSILDAAFGNWTKAQFNKLISACEKYGRANIDAICTGIVFRL